MTSRADGAFNTDNFGEPVWLNEGETCNWIVKKIQRVSGVIIYTGWKPLRDTIYNSQLWLFCKLLTVLKIAHEQLYIPRKVELLLYSWPGVVTLLYSRLGVMTDVESGNLPKHIHFTWGGGRGRIVCHWYKQSGCNILPSLENGISLGVYRVRAMKCLNVPVGFCQYGVPWCIIYSCWYCR